MRALLVDDERLARRELRSLLAEHPDVAIVGEADCVASAYDAVMAHDPDVVFLDVQLTGETGFELLELLPRPPRVVFVTAYDRHALKAFDVNALDYLLKPVHPERLARALDKLREPSTKADSQRQQLAYDDHVWVNDSRGPRFVALCEVMCVRAAGDYSELMLACGDTVLVNRSLKSWEERLPVTQFARIHRGSIVNLCYVVSVEDGCAVHVRGLATPLTMSRRYAARVREKFL